MSEQHEGTRQIAIESCEPLQTMSRLQWHCVSTGFEKEDQLVLVQSEVRHGMMLRIQDYGGRWRCRLLHWCDGTVSRPHDLGTGKTPKEAYVRSRQLLGELFGGDPAPSDVQRSAS